MNRLERVSKPFTFWRITLALLSPHSLEKIVVRGLNALHLVREACGKRITFVCHILENAADCPHHNSYRLCTGPFRRVARPLPSC
jgi:hypothetical protein